MVLFAVLLASPFFVGCVSSIEITSSDQYSEINAQAQVGQTITLDEDSVQVDHEASYVNVETDSVHWFDSHLENQNVRSAPTGSLRRIRCSSSNKHTAGGILVSSLIGAAPGLVIFATTNGYNDHAGPDAPAQTIGAVVAVGGAMIGAIIGTLVSPSTEYLFTSRSTANIRSEGTRTFSVYSAIGAAEFLAGGLQYQLNDQFAVGAQINSINPTGTTGIGVKGSYWFTRANNVYALGANVLSVEASYQLGMDSSSGSKCTNCVRNSWTGASPGAWISFTVGHDGYRGKGLGILWTVGMAYNSVGHTYYYDYNNAHETGDPVIYTYNHAPFHPIVNIGLHFDF